MDWIDINDEIPADGQRVIAFVPGHRVFIPGKSGEMKDLPVIFLTMARDFFEPGSAKFEKHGAHFWLGEGYSNHYFKDVLYWMPIPDLPEGYKK